METMTDESNIVIDVHVTDYDHESFRSELRAGLLSHPRQVPSKYFYDDHGSTLFERICELPEYYQTRTEHQLLNQCADQVVAMTNAEELVELGSGSATKTRILLDSMSRAKQLRMYIPFDVSEGIVRRVAQELVSEYQGLQVHGIVGDFLAHLEHIPNGGHRLLVLLGGTIGNFRPDAAPAFLSSIYEEMGRGDYFLLGVQLETAVDRLEAAYNDAAGITAAFNKNILKVLQATVGADFDPQTFDHIAVYNHHNHWIEMRLRSVRRQQIHIPGLALALTLEEGEEILTEISKKYDRPRTEALLTKSGFRLVHWFTDPEQLVGLALARKE